MSFDFKKLSDVNALEEMKEGLNVLVVDGSEVAKISADEIGAQADWNEADETNPAFVKNRTHWAKPGFEIVWNGDVNEKVIVSIDGQTAIHISDMNDVDQLVGATCDIIIAGQHINGIIYSDSITAISEDGKIYSVRKHPIVLVTEDNATAMGITFPKAGVYCLYVAGAENSCIITKEIVHQLDEKFIPKARTYKYVYDTNSTSLDQNEGITYDKLASAIQSGIIPDIIWIETFNNKIIGMSRNYFVAYESEESDNINVEFWARMITLKPDGSISYNR